MNRRYGSYSHRDAERYCQLCVSVARGEAEDETINEACEHQEQIRSAVLSTLRRLANDGEVDGISNANLAIEIGRKQPELRPTQSCVGWATKFLEEQGEIAKVANFVPGTRMRRPNGYRVTAGQG